VLASDPPIPEYSRKNPEIPILESYVNPPRPEFWKKFPSKSLPVSVETNVLGEVLENLISKKTDVLTEAQLRRGYKSVKIVKFGADSCQASELPPCFIDNAANTSKYGIPITDTIATWIKEGFVAGPFDEPPAKKFRVNCLMAVPQGKKVRPVLNGSLPENKSLNSNVNPIQVEKVKMCSARCFSYSVFEAGDSAILAKMDMLNAYKNVPCKTEDYRLQGFYWLGKFFVETRQIFGARTAVCNYDILANTVLELTLSECDISKKFVHRQLDDVPIVVPAHKENLCKDFITKYKSICNSVGIGLAEDDPNCDKAFSFSKVGKVLGIMFNTVGLMWSYPAEKSEKTVREIVKFVNSNYVSLLQMQKLMGRLNDICLMLPFLQCFKSNLNSILGWLQSHPSRLCKPCAQSKKDVMVWLNVLLEKDTWKPICPRPIGPPLNCFEYTSDAAGFEEESLAVSVVGFGGVGFGPDGEFCYAHQYFWPKELQNKKDSKGARFGSKTLFLELVGLIAPFLLVPNQVKNVHVILNVDNIACFYAWENKYVCNDICSSILIRALVLITSFLSCYVHVRHLPRLSSWEARICDRLSRKSTTSSQDMKLLSNYNDLKMPVVIQEWLKNPVENWDICYDLLNFVKNKVI
jgi:hypothetical protein